MLTASADDKRAAQRALEILNVFRGIDPEMTMGAAASLLLVTIGEQADGSGLTGKGLSEAGGFGESSASRYIGYLSSFARGQKTPLELVSQVPNPMMRREKFVRLTAKGRMLVANLKLTLRM